MKENKDRRRFARLPVGVLISLKSEQDAENFTASYSANLSHGGVFIKTFSPKPVGTKIVLELPHPKPPGFAIIHGVVASHQRLATSEGVKSGMGIKFTEMDADARFSLQHFIDGDWQKLFKDVNCLENEDNAMHAIVNLVEFMQAVFYFPFDKIPFRKDK